MNPRLLILFGFITLLVVPIGAADSYDISTDKMIDIPDRERNVDGETFEITHISQIEQNNTLTVDTSGPDSRYEVNLISPQGQYVRVENIPDGGDATVTFDMSRTVGSWLITITDPGDLVAIHPVVIKAYDIEPDLSTTTVTRGTNVTADITVTEPTGGVRDQKDINRVEAALANESTEVRVTAEAAEDGSDTYEISLSTDELTAGTYEFFGVVRGDQDIRGRDEVLGISGTTTVTVEAPATDTPTESDGDNTGNTAGSGPAGNSGGTGASGDSTADSATTSAPDPDNEPDTVSPPTPNGDTRATVTTRRLGASAVEAEITRSDSTAEADDQSMVATIPTDAASASGAITSNSLTIESNNIAEYSATVSAQDTPTATPSTDPVGAVTVNHTVSDTDITQVAFSISINKSRLRKSNLTGSKVGLYRQHNGSWTRLNTDVVGETSEAVTVQAAAPGLSTFVLANESARAAELTDVSLNRTALTQNDTAAVTATVENPANTTQTYAVQFAVGDRTTTRSITVGAGNRTVVSHYITTLPADSPTTDIYVNGVYTGTITTTPTTSQSTPPSATSTTAQATTTTPTAANDGVISPTATATPATPRSTTSTPGFTPALLLIAISVFVIITLMRP
jgi:PGF-pre-PGF domain-containing protein